MKQKIIFLLFLSCSSLFSAVVQNSQTVYRIGTTVIIQDTVPGQEAIRVVEDFYRSYTVNHLYGTHQDAEVIMKKYLTKRLIEKIDRVGSMTGADPIIRAQDFNETAFETLNVKFMGNNWYMVNYKWNKNDEGSNTNIPLKVTLVDGRYMIDYITPEWNGSLYGDTLLCADIPQQPIDNSSPESTLETFYATYTSLYYSMTEGLLARLEALRTAYLTPNALGQFEEAVNEYKLLDGLLNYDLLIDSFDFDCLWLPSMTYIPLNENTFQISYKQGKLVTAIVVTLIAHDGEYKIESIRTEK